ncbi:MAG: hypothetical protein ACOVOL_01855, partial [Bacteroidia bacterium]
NSSGRILSKSEITLPPLADFLTTDSSIAFDTPNDSVFEQLLIRIIDSALFDSSILASLPLDSSQKEAVLQSLSPQNIELTGLDSNSFLSKTIHQQQQRDNPTANLNFDSISRVVIADSSLTSFEKGLWMRYWVQNQDYAVLKNVFKNSSFPNALNLPSGSSALFLGVAHHRLEQPSLANVYFRVACKDIPLSPHIFYKEKIPIHR